MKNREELKLVGSGGQGVILASVILAEAAVYSGMNASQGQSYGPEARGGACMAQAVITKDELGFPKVRKPTCVLALTQASLEKYSKDLADDCLVIADASLEVPEWLAGKNVKKVAILDSAIAEGCGKAANIVAVAVINAALQLVSEDMLKEAVWAHIPAGTEEMNKKALALGLKLGSEL